ncbi:MAG: hypothetical protein KAU14_08130 [Thermoplasmata archaeon]|nr:hypothetical protein [Thermoplasmata archaeon]
MRRNTKVILIEGIIILTPLLLLFTNTTALAENTTNDNNGDHPPVWIAYVMIISFFGMGIYFFMRAVRSCIIKRDYGEDKKKEPMNPLKLEWIEAKDFFNKRIKSHTLLSWAISPVFLAIWIGYIIIVYYNFPSLTLGLKILLIIMGIFFFLPFLTFTVLHYFAWKRLKWLRKMDKYLLECKWCGRLLPSEIWKEITRYLTKKRVNFTVEVITDSWTKLINIYNIFCQEKGVKISMYGPCKHRGKIPINWVSIGILDPKNKEFYTHMNQMKREIKSLMEKMPEENPFCKRCFGNRSVVCYGGKYFHNDHTLKQKLFDKIDPYKDEETLEYLVDLKERLGDEVLRKDDEIKLKKLAETTDTYKNKITYKND